MSKRRGLGRGLGALIPTDEESAVENKRNGIQTVAVKDIQPNPHQPRTVMDDAKLMELSASIREHGLIQPLIVTKEGDKFTLIAGERRWRASQLAGLNEVPVVIKEATPQEMLELAIIENVQRADLNPLEEAYAYRQLMDEFAMTQEEVAQRMAKGRSTVGNLVRLINLPKNIQQAIVNDEISGAHARALLPLPTPEAQTNAMNQIIKLGLSVRQTERLVTNRLARETPPSKQRIMLPPELADVERQFRERLGTRVQIEQSGKGGGRVIIHYFSNDDLNSVYDVIIGDEGL